MIRSFSMVIPAYNEQDNLEGCVHTVVDQLAALVDDYEVIIINDGSSDRTAEIADRLCAGLPQVRVIHSPRNGGLGDACRRGIAAADKAFIGWVSADTRWPTETLREIVAGAREDIITVYAVDLKKRSLFRRSLSRLFTMIMNALSGRHLCYYNGAAVYRAAVLKSILVESEGLTFWAEALVKALRTGASHREIPADFPERVAGETKAFRGKNLAATARFIIRMTRARLAPQGELSS